MTTRTPFARMLAKLIGRTLLLTPAAANFLGTPRNSGGI
jgi:hypothetical protein